MIISKGLWLHFVIAVFLENRQVSKGALHTPYTQVLSRERVSFGGWGGGDSPSYRSRDQSYLGTVCSAPGMHGLPILLVCNRSLFSRELRECMNLFVGFNSKGTRKDRVICELEMNFKKIFLFAL